MSYLSKDDIISQSEYIILDSDEEEYEEDLLNLIENDIDENTDQTNYEEYFSFDGKSYSVEYMRIEVKEKLQYSIENKIPSQFVLLKETI